MSPTRQKRTSLQRARAVDGVRARRIARFLLSLTVTLLLHGRARVEAQAGGGSIRGLVQDADLDVPLPGVEVLAVEAGRATRSGDQGNYLLEGLEPGRYTLVFTKDGYLRQVRADVVVSAGALTELDVSLSGDFTDLEEFVVQDILQAAAGTEAAMLELRFESPALMDSISADLMSRAGASDAATGLRLVSGASVQDGKFAVIRGLPDRYVSSQMNGVRLPSADEDKRAVELDQFPAAVIESLVVTKTFLPDQQGDASGGAVDVRLKGIPDGTIVEFKAQTTYDTQATGNSEFLSYDGGGVNFLGNDSRDIQTDNLGGNWSGAAGVEEVDAPINYKWSAAVGSRMDLSDDWVLGGFASLFYERDSTFFDNGKDDSYWVDVPGEGLVPQTNQGTPSDGDFKTALFDVTQGSELVQWGGLGTLGLESDEDALGLTYLYSRTAEDTATLAVDTRGKEYFFPGYDPTDPTGTGNTPDTLNAAPYLRLETLEYTERWTSTLQLDGEHELDWNVPEVGGLDFGKPEFTWIGSLNTANLYQPDKRQFGALWHASSFNPGFPPFIPPFTTPDTWFPYKPAANFNLGNFQRIWKEISEDDQQVSMALAFPFERSEGLDGSFKLGLFYDEVEREFRQDSFSNFGDSGAFFEGGFDEPWSETFPDEDHAITESTFDVDYDGQIELGAAYAMLSYPLTARTDLTGGLRLESTDIGVQNFPDADAVWFPPDATAPVDLNPGDADVSISEDRALPAIGLEYRPSEAWTLRASYSRTLARQTFKELSPILQQEFLGGPIFVGNPELELSALDNYDLRADYAPVPGALLSASWFQKDIDAPIEYVQRLVGFTFTTPQNYPDGELSGFELEARQALGNWKPALDGVGIGLNATFIHSQVSLTPEEIAGFSLPEIDAPMENREMTNAPEHLYNAFLTWDLVDHGTQLALFYTVQGDTLLAGAGQSNGNFVPSVFSTEYGALNLSFSQRFGDFLKLQLQAKNLTNPEIETVYRSDYIDGDVTRTSYTKGIEYTLGFSFSVNL